MLDGMAGDQKIAGHAYLLFILSLKRECTSRESGTVNTYSARRVDAGSMWAILLVGRNVAAVAASISSSSTATKVTGS